MNNFDTLINVPEVQTAIVARLWLGDMARCARVCKLWNSVFTRAVWRYHQPYNGFKPTPIFQQAIQRNGHYIRHLQPTFLIDIERYIGHCKNLTSLFVPQGPGFNGKADYSAALTLISENQGLHMLTVEYCNFNNFPFQRALPLLSNLKVLSVRGDNFQLTQLADILNACTGLQSFRLAGDLKWKTPPVADFTLHREDSHPITHMDLGFTALPLHILVSISKHCRLLKRIEIPPMDSTETNTYPALLAMALRDYWQNIEYLDMSGMATMSIPENEYNHHFSLIFRAIYKDKLRALHLPKLFLPRSFESLLLEHPLMKLEVLDFTGAVVPLSSHAFQTLLTRSTLLKRIFVTDTKPFVQSSEADIKTHVFPAIQATDIVSSTWGCLKLEHFGIPIQGICRLSIDTCRVHHDTCLPLQNQVFQQLGRLEHLKQIVLSSANGYSIHTQESALSFAPNDGVEYLASLTKLEVLDVRGTAHNIQDAEKAWLHQTFPKLRRLLLD